VRFHQRAQVADLKMGETFVVARQDDGSIHFSGFNDPPVWEHKIATVESCTEIEGTAVDGEVIERDGCTIYTAGQASEYVLNIRVDGSPFSVQVRGNVFVTSLAPHHPVCGECGQLWPCVDDRMDAAGRRLEWELADLCGHCGESIGAAWSVSYHDGLTLRKYHQAQKYRGPDRRRCRDVVAALKASNSALFAGQEVLGSDESAP
jgi:hypothetical protein